MLYSPGAAATSVGSSAVQGDVITRVPPIDPASTNLLLQSAAFDNASWTLVNGALVAANSTVAPNGILEADTLNDPGGALAQVQQDVVIANDNGVYWASAYFTLGTSLQSRFGLLLTGGAAVDAFVDFNPASGAAINSSGTFAVEAISIEGVTWYRVSVKNTNNTSGNVTARTYVQPASTSAATLGTVIGWGAQLEKRSSVTQYIPTTTVAVARTTGKLPNWILDNPTAAGGGSLVLISRVNAAGTTFATFAAGIDGTYDEYLITCSDVQPTANNGAFQIQVSEDAGGTWKGIANYGWSLWSHASNVTTSAFGSASDNTIVLATNTPSNANTLSGEVRFWAPSVAGRHKAFHSFMAYEDSGGLFRAQHGAGFYIGTTNAINGVRLLFNSGGANFTLGNFALYGLKKA